MLNSLSKRACVKLTADQIEAIKQQTGLDNVPETLSLSVDIFADGKVLHGPLRGGLDTELGLLHETNRT